MIFYKVSYIHKNDELRQIYTIEVTVNNLEELLSENSHSLVSKQNINRLQAIV